MSYATKLRITTAVLGVAVATAFYGFSRVQAEAVAGRITSFSLVLLFGGSVAGTAAGVLRIYFRSRMKHATDAAQVRAEALAEAGKKSKK